MCTKGIENLFALFPGTGTEQIEYIDGIRFITFQRETDLNEYTYYEEQFKQVCSSTSSSKIYAAPSNHSQHFPLKPNEIVRKKPNKSNQCKLFKNKKILEFNKGRIMDSVCSKDVPQCNNYQCLMEKQKQKNNGGKHLNRTNNINEQQLTLSFRKIKNITRFNLPAKQSNSISRFTLIEEIKSLIIDMIDYVDQNLNITRNISCQNFECSTSSLKLNNKRRRSCNKDHIRSYKHAKKSCNALETLCGNISALKHNKVTLIRGVVSYSSCTSLEMTTGKKRFTGMKKVRVNKCKRNKETFMDLIGIIDKFNRLALEEPIGNEDTEVRLANSEQINGNMAITLRKYEFDWRRKILNQMRIKVEEEKHRLHVKDCHDKSMEISCRICNSVKVPITDQAKSLCEMLIWCDAHVQYNCSCYLPVYYFKTNTLLMKSSRKDQQIQLDVKKLPAKIMNETVHFYDVEEKCARTAGVLINYRARNKCIIFKKKRFKEVIDGILIATNSYVKIKFNYDKSERRKSAASNSEDVVKRSANYMFISNTSILSWQQFDISKISSTSTQSLHNLSADCNKLPTKPYPFHLKKNTVNVTAITPQCSRTNLPLMRLSRIDQRNVKFKPLSNKKRSSLNHKHQKMKKYVHKEEKSQMILTSQNNQLSKNFSSIEELKTKRLSEYCTIENTSDCSSSLKQYIDVNRRWIIEKVSYIEDNSDDDFFGFDSDHQNITSMKPQPSISQFQPGITDNMVDSDLMKANTDFTINQSDSNVIRHLVNQDEISINKTLINTDVQCLPNNNRIKSLRKRKHRTVDNIDSDAKKSQLTDITNTINIM